MCYIQRTYIESLGSTQPCIPPAVMLTRPAGYEAKAEAEARKSEADDEAEAQNFFSKPWPQCMRPRPDTLENNSVCMSMKTKILAFRTQFSVSNEYTTEMIVDGYIVKINVMCTVNIQGHEANFYEAEARCHEAEIEAEARKSEAKAEVEAE